MDFKHKPNDVDPQKLEEIYDKLTSMSRQLIFLQGFMESKFGSEFAEYCQLPQTPTTPTLEGGYPCVDGRSMSDDPEEYDKMPNLVSQESPSRTLGFVSVPLRQSSSSAGGPSHSSKMHSTHAHLTSGSSKRERIKGESGLSTSTVSEDLMYPLNNFSNFTDIIVGNAGEAEGTATTPEFMEMELDPSQLLRGEPPALQPMYSDNNDPNSLHSLGNNSTNQPHAHSSKRGGAHRQSNMLYKYDAEGENAPSNGNLRGGNPGQRRASVGGHENNHTGKKYDCLMCGIQFDYPETLKSHMDSHAASRNMRSNSEDQSGMIEENGGSLPRLLPRPPIPLTPGELELPDPPAVKASKSKRNQSSQQSSSSSSCSSSKESATKRRKRYNQSRPCSLECPECGLKIRDKSRLIEHLRGHTGERPFQCPCCDKSYTRKDVLKTHMIKMHGEMPTDQDQDSLSNSSGLEIYKSCE